METVERELAKGVGDILSLICPTFVFVLRLGCGLLHLFVCSGWRRGAGYCADVGGQCRQGGADHILTKIAA